MSRKQNAKTPLHRRFLIWVTRNKSTFTRAERRLHCGALATIEFIEEDLTLDGALLDVATRGALFRPATRFVLMRQGESVNIKAGPFTVKGEVRNTSTSGYGVKFHDVIEQSTVDMIMGLPKFSLLPDSSG